jgi:hypothetical protein
MNNHPLVTNMKIVIICSRSANVTNVMRIQLLCMVYHTCDADSPSPLGILWSLGYVVLHPVCALPQQGAVMLHVHGYMEQLLCFPCLVVIIKHLPIQDMVVQKMFTVFVNYHHRIHKCDGYQHLQLEWAVDSFCKHAQESNNMIWTLSKCIVTLDYKHGLEVRQEITEN